MVVIYLKEFSNGKLYVGVTKEYDRRMYNHEHPSSTNYNKPLYRAMKIHTHTTEILMEFEDYSKALEYEKLIIRNFKDLGYELYNLTDGGDSLVGDENPMARPYSYYETNSIPRYQFKDICKRRGWNFEEFLEIKAPKEEWKQRATGGFRHTYYYKKGGVVYG